MTANNDLHLDIRMFHMKKIAHDLTMKPTILIDLFVRCHLPPFFSNYSCFKYICTVGFIQYKDHTVNYIAIQCPIKLEIMCPNFAFKDLKALCLTFFLWNFWDPLDLSDEYTPSKT